MRANDQTLTVSMKLVNEMGHLTLIIRADSRDLRETRDGRDGEEFEISRALSFESHMSRKRSGSTVQQKHEGLPLNKWQASLRHNPAEWKLKTRQRPPSRRLKPEAPLRLAQPQTRRSLLLSKF